MGKNESFQVEDFLKDNYPLFTIMGVFGALALYLQSISPPNRLIYIDIGVASCLILFILVSGLILRRAIDKPSETLIDTIFRFLFIISFITLLLIIIYHAFTTYPEPLELFSYILAYVFGIILPIGILRPVEEKAADKNIYILVPFFMLVISILIFYLAANPIYPYFQLMIFSFSTGLFSALNLVKLLFLIFKKMFHTAK